MPFARDVTLKQLRALTAIAETGSVSAAAERLHVTPPAVSLQLKQFEKLAGLDLFERTGKGLRPTEAGIEVLRAARRIDLLLTDCGEGLDNLKGMSKGSVRIGVVSTAKYFAPRALARFKQLNRDVEITLQVGNRTETIRALEAFEFDFAIMGRPPAGFDVAREMIGPHPHILIAPPDHRLVGKRGLTSADLSDEVFLLREQGSGTRELSQNLILEAGGNATSGMEMGSNETIKQAVMAGLGIAVISAHTTSVEIEEGRLAVLDVVGLPIERSWQVIRRTQKRLMPAGQALWDFLVQKGKTFLPPLPKPY